MTEIGPLRDGERRDAAFLLGAAFHDDPYFRFLVPDDTRRRKFTPAFFGWMLHELADEGDALACRDGAVLTGVIGLVAPGRARRAHPLRFLARRRDRPPLATPRLRRWITGIRMIRLMERVHHRDRHQYVAVLGVSPAYRGRGLGAALLREAADRADRAGAPSYLETTNPDNVGYYGRFGYTLIAEHPTPDGGPPMWTMIRSGA